MLHQDSFLRRNVIVQAKQQVLDRSLGPSAPSVALGEELDRGPIGPSLESAHDRFPIEHNRTKKTFALFPGCFVTSNTHKSVRCTSCGRVYPYPDASFLSLSYVSSAYFLKWRGWWHDVSIHVLSIIVRLLPTNYPTAHGRDCRVDRATLFESKDNTHRGFVVETPTHQV